MKDPKVEEHKSSSQEVKALAPQRFFNHTETFAQARKKKKKKDKQHWGRKPQEGSTPAIGGNNPSISGGRNLRKNQNGPAR